jgi:RHS repeat-associated protein
MFRPVKFLLYFALMALAMSASAFVPAGNVINRQDAKNEVTHYNYNALNRLTNVVHESQQKAAFTYDANGNRTKGRDQKSEVSFGYDSMNRLSTTLISVNSRSFAVTNSYDLNGNRTNIVYPGGLSVGYSYDAENRLFGVTVSAPSAPLREFSFGYDGASRLTGISSPNGINSSFGYDAESRMTNYTHSSFISRSIIRDPRGFKKHENIAAGLSPSIPEGEQRFTNSDADQTVLIAQRDSWLGGELNQWYDRNYTYDNNGCLTQENVSRPEWNTNSAIQEYTTDYGWDFDNRLVSVTGGASSTSTAYLYDAGGARIGRIANGVTNCFVLDYRAPLKMPLAETDADGNITRYYIWSSHGLLAHLDVNPSTGAITATRYYHADEQGSTLALTDENGAVTDQFSYSPYGKCTARTGTTQTPFQWLGGIAVQNEGDGLYYMLNRYYSADMKRFIQQDPSGIDGGVNLYAYCVNNPTAYSDPFGLCADYSSPFANNTGRSLSPSIPSVAGAGGLLPFVGDLDTLTSSASIGWKIAAVGSIALDATGIGLLPGTSTSTLRAGMEAAKSETQLFRHYGYAEDAAKFEGGLKPGGYATQAHGRPMGGGTAQERLALPHEAPPNAYYKIRVGTETPIQGPSPVRPTDIPPRTGGGIEYYFPEGTPPGSVEGPFLIR